MTDNSIVENRSKLKDFLASIATIRGDLSNITAPPFVLDDMSAVELPAFWAERPSIFVAPATSEDPLQRALLVLRWFLCSLRNQQYAGHSEAEGVKKPLNAFLGELFLAKWEDDEGTTRIVSEQVSHHPPVTACRVWNEKHGVSAEGFTRQEITFSGSVNVQQIGHATFHVDKYDETYYIPLPNMKIKGVLTGTPYPETHGTYYIYSTNNYTSKIDFSGQGLFSSKDKKHSFEASLYQESNQSSSSGEKNPLYTISGNWNSTFVIHNVKTNKDVETVDISVPEPKSPIVETDILNLDPWESHRAWNDVRSALKRGDMQAVSDAKNRLEEGQRQMRKDEEQNGTKWESIFFHDVSGPASKYRDTPDMKVSEKLADIAAKSDPSQSLSAMASSANGLWRFNRELWDEQFASDSVHGPYHGSLCPDNTRIDSSESHQQDRTDKKSDDKSQANAISATKSSRGEAREVPAQPQSDTTSNLPPDDNAVLHEPARREEQEKERKALVQQDVQQQLDGMTIREKDAVEDMLRNRYSSS